MSQKLMEYRETKALFKEIKRDMVESGFLENLGWTIVAFLGVVLVLSWLR